MGLLVLAAVVVARVCDLWPFGVDADSDLPDDRFKSAAAVRVYDIQGHRAYSESDIAAARVFADMEAGEFVSYVSSAEYRDGKSPYWKGSSLAVVTLQDGTTQHIAVSYHGRFFKVRGQSGCWLLSQAPENDPFSRIIQEQFIPARLRED